MTSYDVRILRDSGANDLIRRAVNSPYRFTSLIFASTSLTRWALSPKDLVTVVVSGCQVGGLPIREGGDRLGRRVSDAHVGTTRALIDRQSGVELGGRS